MGAIPMSVCVAVATAFVLKTNALAHAFHMYFIMYVQLYSTCVFNYTER